MDSLYVGEVFDLPPKSRPMNSSTGDVLRDLSHARRHFSSSSIFVHVFAAVALLFMSACMPASPSVAVLPMVGEDADEHGCMGSAGYVWSNAQQRCLRLFEDGFSFDPHMDNPEQSFKAFVVLGSDAGRPQTAELFLPQSPQAIALEVLKTPAGDIRPVVLRNATDHIEIVRVKDMYVLSVNGQVKFTHDAVLDSPLSKI
jgi:hypothetical protein